MKNDLTKATFIIPIKIESEDRLRNIITSVCFLVSNFDTKIIVKEVDEESLFLKLALPQITEYCGDDIHINYLFEESKSSSFHRQKVLNDMIMESDTDIIVNYDCDILLPIDSYLKSYDMILNKSSDLVYPYGNGNYQRQVFATDEVVTKFLVNDFDFGVFDTVSKIYDAKYGFCQFFRREVYIEGGMENENFIAYAPEDVERYYRFNTLGYKVDRIDSIVYHLEHIRTPNSWFTNPHMESNNEEWDKIQSMDKDTLKEYITNQKYYQNRVNG